MKSDIAKTRHMQLSLPKKANIIQIVWAICLRAYTPSGIHWCFQYLLLKDRNVGLVKDWWPLSPFKWAGVSATQGTLITKNFRFLNFRQKNQYFGQFRTIKFPKFHCSSSHCVWQFCLIDSLHCNEIEFLSTHQKKIYQNLLQLKFYQDGNKMFIKERSNLGHKKFRHFNNIFGN